MDPPMKIRLLMLLAVGLAAACSQKPQDAAPQASAPSQSSEACTQSAAYSPLPGGIEVTFPFHLRSDRFFTNKKDKLRRRVTLELLEGDAGTAFDSASQSLVAAGYKAKGEPKGEPTTRRLQAFTKKGQPSILLASNFGVGDKPANPAAVGLVSFEWTPPGATKVAAK
jgi:hypothetical protein